MNDRARIERQKSDPALVRLHRSLSRLGSVLTIMNTGAHPDDEQNGILAWFRFGLGMRVVIACSTRGEGGQNVLGPERGGALGILRSREMEEAARVLDADVAWLGFGPEDPVHDFGFSKTGEGTLERWGEERIVERLVRAYRRERPDIVIPTFLDVPGQHGHHRAMTRAARAATKLAADPSAYPEHVAEGLAAWQVSHFYLPAWSGGGATYDDELPPPVPTLTICAEGRDVPTGGAWDHIGEWSRACHACQGMGRWRDEPRRVWALHLEGGGPEGIIGEGLPRTLADLAAQPGAPKALATAADAVAEAIAAFPAADTILKALLRADRALEEAEQAGDQFPHRHRVQRKRREVQTAIFEASGVTIRAWHEPAQLAPGSTGSMRWHADGPVRLQLVPPAGVSIVCRDDNRIVLEVREDAPFSSQFLEGWSALGGNGNAPITAEMSFDDRSIRRLLDPEEDLRVVPARLLQLEPDAFVLPRGLIPPELHFRAKGAVPAFAASPGIDIGDGTITLSPDLAPGLHVLEPMVDGRPAMRMKASSYPHVGDIAYFAAEHLRLLVLDLKLPKASIAFIGGGGDRIALWMTRMGLDVTVLDHVEPETDLSPFSTVVLGIVALASRRDVVAAAGALHDFVENGGHLLTLYQRPDQGWTEGFPPRPLVIGTPSLRWRVTNPAATVVMLVPDHPLLTGPNVIGPEDWDGWDKERGIYFAAWWDDAYEPLLAMSDPGEAPLQGALVSGRIGKGRHTHVGLVLHHQLDRLVPGAFRLLANLVQPA